MRREIIGLGLVLLALEASAVVAFKDVYSFFDCDVHPISVSTMTANGKDRGSVPVIRSRTRRPTSPRSSSGSGLPSGSTSCADGSAMSWTM